VSHTYRETQSYTLTDTHILLGEHEDVRTMAQERGVELLDLRKPIPVKDLHFWTGEIFDVDVPIIAVLGTDTALGKRTAAMMVKEAWNQNGGKAEMVYTGQTGWMQGEKYGFIFDATLNDFVSGELEHAILTCWKETRPDLILLEGQSSLRNPSGPCGLEYLISGNAKYVILIHSPNQVYFHHNEAWGKLPSLKSEIEIIEKFGSKVIALALNTNGLSYEEAKKQRDAFAVEFEITVLLPIEEGVDDIIPIMKALQV